MGRLKKYNTEEEKKEARKAAFRKYYWKNKEACDNRSKLNYHKRNGLSKNLQQDSS